MKYLLVLLVTLSVTACSEDPYRHLYDGIKANNDAKRTPTDRATSPSPNYDDYKKERDAQSEKS